MNRIYTIVNKIGLQMVRLYSDVKQGLEMVRFNNEYGFTVNSGNSGRKERSCNE